MRERPILFSSPMVRAILSGAKTQTRRIVKNAHMMSVDGELVPIAAFCPYGQPGARLWVREAWRVGAWDESAGCVATDYKADGYCRREWLRVDDEDLFIRLRQQCIDDARAALGPADRYTWEPGRSPCRWRPSIHMPRWASRITLEITDVRVERLQDISEADAKAEGCKPIRPELVQDGLIARPGRSAVEEFRLVWEEIHGGGSWEKNPWVWVIEFKKLGDDMDIVICPGCGEDVPHDNNGCPHCGYENGWNGADGRLMTLRELLAEPSYPEIGAMEMNNVCPAFLRRLAEEAVKAHNA